ncbi:hypothetical protein FRC11_001968 [Ceratobasidium sp. 423]|nr:hypothetical protein FRC11_001968 [Ceratobasidium sp. 423]
MEIDMLKEVLQEIDEWMHGLQPRWMDLVGDYAANKFFVVDGDSLCQMAQNDGLVANQLALIFLGSTLLSGSRGSNLLSCTTIDVDRYRP